MISRHACQITYLLISIELAFGISSEISHILLLIECASRSEYFICLEESPSICINKFIPSFSVLYHLIVEWDTGLSSPLRFQNHMLLCDLIGCSVHSWKMTSVKLLFIQILRLAIESDIPQRPGRHVYIVRHTPSSTFMVSRDHSIFWSVNPRRCLDYFCRCSVSHFTEMKFVDHHHLLIIHSLDALSRTQIEFVWCVLKICGTTILSKKPLVSGTVTYQIGQNYKEYDNRVVIQRTYM
jgi:hypothetical protein